MILVRVVCSARETAIAPIPEIVRAVNSEARPVIERIPEATTRMAMIRRATLMSRMRVELAPALFAARPMMKPRGSSMRNADAARRTVSIIGARIEATLSESFRGSIKAMSASTLLGEVRVDTHHARVSFDWGTPPSLCLTQL